MRLRGGGCKWGDRDRICLGREPECCQGLGGMSVVMRAELMVWWRAGKRMWGLQWVQSGGMDMWWDGIPALMSWSRMSAGMSAWGRGVVVFG